jgi:hypothetical protein
MKKPSRVWGSLVQRRRSVMRSRQALETHLNRQSDLPGTRERISTRASSGSRGTAAAAAAAAAFLRLLPLRTDGRSRGGVRG